MPGPLAAGEDQMSEVPPSSDVRGSGRTNHVNMNNYPRASARSSAVGGEKKMHAPGSIPKYLQKFKQAKEDEKAKKEADAKKIKVPEGYRLVEEDERLATMEWFSEELACLGKEMQKLPIRIETLAQKKREKDLLERKTRLEDGVKMFSKKLVFLPADSEPLCGDFSANCNYNCNDDEESTTVEDLAPAVPDTNDRLFGGYEEEPVPRDAENSNYARHFTRNADLLSHDNVSGHRPISPSDPNFEYPAHHPPGARGPAAVHRLPGRSGAEDGGNFLNGYNYKEPAAVYQEPGMGFEAEAGATDITHPSSQSGAHYMDIERNGEPVSGAGYSFYGGGGAGSQQDSYRSSDPIVNKPAMVLKNKVVNNVNIKLNLPLPGGKEQPATPPSAQSSQLQSLLDEFLKYYNFAVKHLSVARESVEGRHLTPHAPCERAAEGGDTMKERGQLCHGNLSLSCPYCISFRALFGSGFKSAFESAARTLCKRLVDARLTTIWRLTGKKRPRI
eukprot:g17793.t1